MRSDVPVTTRFTMALEAALLEEARRRRRRRRPFSAMALARLRRFSASAGHVALAFVMSATLLLMSPDTLRPRAELPPVAAPPRAGYLAQYGAPVASTATELIAFARESGFEVEVRRTYVADRAADGAVVELRHLVTPVSSVPVDQPARGLLLVVIGFTVGDGDTTAN